MKDLTAERIVELLGLEPLPREGGRFAESYRAGEGTAAAALPARYGGARRFSTAIYYLLTPDAFSALHRLRSDEVFHFYLGDPVEMLQLRPDGSGALLRLGTDLAAGERPQVVVPRGVWQGARLAAGGRLALLGCTVAPGYEPEDFEAGRRDDLIAGWPEFRDLIVRLTAG